MSWLDANHRRFIKRPDDDSDDDNEIQAWTTAMEYLRTDPEMEKHLFENDSGDGAYGIVILDYIIPSTIRNIQPVNPLTNAQRATEKVMINYKYSSNMLDLNLSTFKEATQRNHYRKSECWINSLYDFMVINY